MSLLAAAVVDVSETWIKKKKDNNSERIAFAFALPVEFCVVIASPLTTLTLEKKRLLWLLTMHYKLPDKVLL